MYYTNPVHGERSVAKSNPYGLYLLAFSWFALSGASLNLVFFSYDRPLQLYALLESCERNIAGCEHIAVVYRCSSSEFLRAYEQVREDFPAVEFLLQKQVSDFKPLTLQALASDCYEYCMFAVDDIIITRPIDGDTCVTALENSRAHGCYLRLGKNISHCYMTGKRSGVPALTRAHPGFYTWNFRESSGDWNYPHTVDLTIYRTADIAHNFEKLSYNNPNVLEGNWASVPAKTAWGVCPEFSCMVNCPFNVVQAVFPNRTSNTATVQDLLLVFNAGFKLDIAPLQAIYNTAPHMDYVPTFILRK